MAIISKLITGAATIVLQSIETVLHDGQTPDAFSSSHMLIPLDITRIS